jgi:hypothetical protein
LKQPIWWKFVCNNGCHAVSPTHLLFHELFKPLSCGSKPSTSKSYEFRSNGLYHTFDDGLHKSLLIMANIFASFFAKCAPSHFLA